MTRVGFSGGGGDDLLISESTAGASIYGGDGNDTIKGGPGNDTVDGGAGSDNMSGGTGQDTLTYYGGFAPVYIDLRGTSVGGESGEDDVVAPDFENAIGEDAGGDTIIGNNADNVLSGYTAYAPDTINGMAGNDTIYGGGGSDHLFGGGGVDHIYGEYGSDRIYASSAQNKIFAYGGAGHDALVGDVLGKSVSVEAILNT